MKQKFKRIVSFIRKLYNQPTGRIPLHAPVFIGNEKKYLLDCLESTYVSSVGKYVDQFEEKISEYTCSKRSVACVNGTSALHIALKLSGVEPDTEVITQPLTFIATVNAIKYCGAEPVFIDIDLETLGLSPFSLEKWLCDNVIFKKTHNILPKTGPPIPFDKVTNRRISACVPMHTFGHPCRINEIVDICNKYYIPVIEDAAESLGSLYQKKHTGTFSKIGVLSFNGNKIITTGGGGMLLFGDEELAKKAKHLTTQAKMPHAWEFIHDQVGYNYRMPNINAALGLAQLEQMEMYIKNKRSIAKTYREFFNSLGIEFFTETTNAQSNYWLNSIILKTKQERDSFLEYSNQNDIMTRPAWTLMSKLDLFNESRRGDLSNAELITDRLVNLPSSLNFNRRT